MVYINTMYTRLKPYTEVSVFKTTVPCFDVPVFSHLYIYLIHFIYICPAINLVSHSCKVTVHIGYV